MAVFNRSFSIDSKGFTSVVDITSEVLRAAKESGIRNGSVLVFVASSTCGVTTIEYEPGCVLDLKRYYERIAPLEDEYKHNLRWGDGNGFSHVRAAATKANFIFPIVEGEPILGTWQQIVLVDFDNKKRNRTVYVQVMGE